MILEKAVQRNSDLIRSQFEGSAKIVLLEGSFAMGNYHESSDLDFEVVVESFVDLMFKNCLPELERLFVDINRCLDVVSNSQGIDIIQVKQTINGVATGVRFIKKSVFVDIIETDFVKVRTNRFLLSIRAKHKNDQALYYEQRNFFGEHLRVKKKYWSMNGYQFTLVPVIVFNEAGSLFPGSMLDRYLANPKILVDDESLAKNGFGKLKMNICMRYMNELRENGRVGGGSLQCLCRWENFPNTTKELFIEQERDIYKLVNQNVKEK